MGGGIIGLSVAWRLSQAGCHVTIFDKNATATEASWAAAGMLAPGGEVFEPSEDGPVLLESRSLYREFICEIRDGSGLPIDYQESGAIDLAYSDSSWQKLLARGAQQSQIGIESQPVSPAAVASGWPQLRSLDLAGALFYPGDASVNPRELAVALKVCCTARGASIQERTPVHELAVTSDKAVLKTSRDEEFDLAVIAAGAWSSRIPVSGVPPLPRVEPVKGHLIGYAQPAGTCASIVRHGASYFLQRANGLLIAGSSMEHVGFDREVQAATVNSLAKEAAFVLPGLAKSAPSEAWVGFRPAASALQLGRWHSDRLYLAYGHFRNGVLLAPYTADRIASLVRSAA